MQIFPFISSPPLGGEDEGEGVSCFPTLTLPSPSERERGLRKLEHNVKIENSKWPEAGFLAQRNRFQQTFVVSDQTCSASFKWKTKKNSQLVVTVRGF